MHLQWNCAQKSKKVGNGLRCLNAQHAPTKRQQQYSGDKKDTLPGQRQESSGAGFAHDLLHHVAHDNETLERKTAALEPQCQRTAGNHIRVIPEDRDKLRRKQKNQSGNDA